MKKLLAIAVALALSACQTTDTNSVITQVQQTAIKVCSFVPTVETVASILALNNPLLKSAGDIANAICSAVGPKLAPRASSPGVGPSVGGILIKGDRI